MLNILQKILKRLNLVPCVPRHLAPNGRKADQSFKEDCKLYRGFEPSDMSPVDGKILTENIKFPDFSCNWSKYSVPEDIRFRIAGCENDGCYSVTTKVARFDSRATPVHDPIDKKPWYNYSHVEVRALRAGEDAEETIPPKKRKLTNSIKLKYREHFSNHSIIELDPIPTKR